MTEQDRSRMKTRLDKLDCSKAINKVSQICSAEKPSFWSRV